MQQLVTVSMQELDRMKCIEAVIDGSLTPIRAAERMGLTSRQVRRLACDIGSKAQSGWYRGAEVSWAHPR